MLELLRDPEAVLALGAWTYAVLGLAVAIDGVVPVVPSEVLAIAAGTFVARGALDGRLVVPTLVAGGIAGDLVTYHLGRVGSRRARRVLTAAPRRRRTFERLGRALARHRTTTIVVARFVPDGRTGVGLLAGLTRLPRRGFLAASALGVSLWTTYVVGLGFLAGRAAADAWVSVGAGLALGLVVGGIGTLVTRRRRDAVTSAPASVAGGAGIAA